MIFFIGVFMLLIPLKQGFQLVCVDGLLELLVFLTSRQNFSEGAIHNGRIDFPPSYRVPRSLCLMPPMSVLGSLADEVEEPENQVAGESI